MCSAESIPPLRRWRTTIRPPPPPPRRRSIRRFRPHSGSCRAIRRRGTSRPRRCRAFFPGRSRRCSKGASWSANWSSASSADTSAEIAPGQIVTTSTDANQPGFQQLAQAYAMLSEFGGSQLSATAQQAVADAASSLVSQGVDSHDQYPGQARLDPERRHRRQQFDELAAHDPATAARQSRRRQRQHDGAFRSTA